MKIFPVPPASFPSAKFLKILFCPKSGRLTTRLSKVVAHSPFSDCLNLHAAILPRTTSIGNRAFKDCRRLKKLVIAGTATSTIGHNALSAIPTLFLTEPSYATSLSLGALWKNWGNYYSRYNWTKVYSNYKGKGALDDPASYEMGWTR